MTNNPAESPADILQVQGLAAGHGQLVAVRGLSFALARGECVALIGANGAGKTTLLRCLAGAHPALAGRVHLAGQDITALPAHRRVRQGLALVPEGRRLWADMSVRENLQVALEHRDAERAEAAAQPWTLDRALQALPGLRPILDRPAGALSGGQRQAAAIARALMGNPEVLLLDEVSLGLSPLVVDEVYRSLKALRAQAGTTLLLVEQDLGRALSVADRVLCLREGQIVLEAACAQTTREAVTQAYFGMGPAAGAHATVPAAVPAAAPAVAGPAPLETSP